MNDIQIGFFFFTHKGGNKSDGTKKLWTLCSTFTDTPGAAGLLLKTSSKKCRKMGHRQFGLVQSVSEHWITFLFDAFENKQANVSPQVNKSHYEQRLLKDFRERQCQSFVLKMVNVFLPSDACRLQLSPRARYALGKNSAASSPIDITVCDRVSASPNCKHTHIHGDRDKHTHMHIHPQITLSALTELNVQLNHR